MYLKFLKEKKAIVACGKVMMGPIRNSLLTVIFEPVNFTNCMCRTFLAFSPKIHL
jgi:hypothetical protein